MLNTLKSTIKKHIRKYNTGDKLILSFKKLTGRLPVPDMDFPELIGIELCSSCNLKCVHCPPQSETGAPKHGMLDFDLFLRIMDEIDSAGKRRIALHKDGEPLLYPKIIDVLNRIKQNQEHEVYLSTNAHKLNQDISRAILDGRIDIINFSIGAATAEFYTRVRGNGFTKVIENILAFIDLADTYEKKPLIQVQIINLPEYPDMSDEIISFKDTWSQYNVKIDVWDKLTWGLYDNGDSIRYRYPCYSLWNSIEVNSDSTVSACCMDWKHELIIGNISKDSIRSIWHSDALNNLRKQHICDNGVSINACNKCNYWYWQQRLITYSEK